MGLDSFAWIAHVAAGVLCIIELGLTAYLASVFSGWFYNSTPSAVSFMVFNSVWSILVLLYVGLTPIYMTSLFHKLASLALNALTTLFWFAGSIALAVIVSPNGSCGANNVCGSARAAVAFGFFLWIIFMFLTVLDALHAMKSRGHATKGPAAYPGA